MSERRDYEGLTGAEIDTLWCLFKRGPTYDGDLPSKSGRDSLVEGGWAFRVDGWNSLTEKGVKAALERTMGYKKEAK